MICSHVEKELIDQGWVMLHGALRDRPEASMMECAKFLGKPVPSRPKIGLIDRLQAIPSGLARTRSLSRQHGMGQFPFHTDTAHWLTPARFLLLGCLNPGQDGASTLLCRFEDLDFNSEEKGDLTSGAFLIRNGRTSWYSSILSTERPYVRFDTGCMTPATDQGAVAAQILNKRLAACSPIRVHWEAGDLLIVDNWRLLHGRESTDGSQTRALLRMLAASEE